MNTKVMELKDVEVWDGNMANSQAFRQADVDVVAAYPITPSTATGHCACSCPSWGACIVQPCGYSLAKPCTPGVSKRGATVNSCSTGLGTMYPPDI